MTEAEKYRALAADLAAKAERSQTEEYRLECLDMAAAYLALAEAAEHGETDNPAPREPSN